MKNFLSLALLISLLACETKKNDEPKVVYEYPQDLSYIQSSQKNGCFRLRNSEPETAYLYLDVQGVKAIQFFSDEELGTSHVKVVQGLTTDGRLIRILSLVTNYKKTDSATYYLPEAEDIKAIRVRGYSNYPSDVGGRQRVNINIFTEDSPETPVVPHLNCDPKEQPDDLVFVLKEAFTKSAPYNFKFLK